MHTCIHTCTHIHTHAHALLAHTHTHMHACRPTQTHLVTHRHSSQCTHTPNQTLIPDPNTHACEDTFVNTGTHTHTLIDMCALARKDAQGSFQADPQLSTLRSFPLSLGKQCHPLGSSSTSFPGFCCSGRALYDLQVSTWSGDVQVEEGRGKKTMF